MKRLILPTLAMLTLLAPGIGAQPIRVRVDDQPVAFGAVGPREINGRVLVPLRGVLEQMGAFVGWDAANQTVIAERGDLNLRLPIGSNRAIVNGQPVRLDVPAMTIAGTTMVPLRFVSTALGANVNWDSQDRMVMIDTSNATGNASFDNDNDRRARAFRRPGANVTPSVFAVSTDFGGGVIADGDTVHVRMRATPGGRAFFRIRGAVGERRMTEVSPGVYEGSWTNNSGHDINTRQSDVLAFVVIGKTASAEIAPGDSTGL